jgi:hypothetical protein
MWSGKDSNLRPPPLHGNRTQATRHDRQWSPQRELNPRSSPYQGDALPLCYTGMSLDRIRTDMGDLEDRYTSVVLRGLARSAGFEPAAFGLGNRRRFRSGNERREMVGMPGFEPGSSRSRSERDTKLRHIPMVGEVGLKPTSDTTYEVAALSTELHSRMVPAERLELPKRECATRLQRVLVAA